MQLKKDREEDIDEDIVLTDICSKSNKKIHYIRSKDKDSQIKIQASYISSWDYSQWFHSLLKDIFLPKGYPDSVSDDYLEYQIWDTCQAFCSSISGTLTMRAVMQGIGVGSEAANPVSAAITWIMKDGTGMIGSILFAWLKGSKLDSDCKKWRLFADVLNDIAMFIELYIPFVIEYSMYMLCLSTAFKALVGTAGSSTRAALVTHQAVKGNIADVSAKDGSQEIFTNLFAFVFGVAILKNITETNHIWILMCTATFFHLFFNYKAVRCLKMNIFNGERFRLSLRTYLPTSCVPTVEQVNRREPVFLGMGTTNRQLFGFNMIFGVSLRKVVQSNEITADQLSTIVTIFQDKKYLILVHNEKKILYIAFRKNFNETHVFKAYFHASLIAIAITYLQLEQKLHIIMRARKNSPVYRLLNILQEFDALQTESNLLETNVVMKAYMACESFVDKEFSAFCKICRGQGWNIGKHLINIDDWRSDWVYGEKTDENFLRKAKQRQSKPSRARPTNPKIVKPPQIPNRLFYF